MYSLDNKGYLSLMGRILMAAIFLLSGMNKLLHPQETQQYMAPYGLGATQFFLLGAIVMELGAGLCLLVGFATRLAAAVLVLFTVTAALIFHTNFGDQMQMIHFLKNLAMVGGLIYIYAYGAGRISLDAQRWGADTVAGALPPEVRESRRLGRTG